MNKLSSCLAFAGILTLLAACNHPGGEKIVYPVTDKVNQVDNYFGTSVADPYRWLENDTAQKVKTWIEDENKVTNDYLSKIPFRSAIKKRLTDIWNYERYSSPDRAGDYYFFSKNSGLQNQSVIYYQKGLDGTPQVFIDPNALSSDGTTSVSLLSFSKDKKYVAYSIRQAGSDWKVFHVMEIATHKELADKLEWIKFSGASWKDNGFYYSRYNAPAKGMELLQKNDFQKVYYHKLGDPQERDELVYQDTAHSQRFYGAYLTEDERFLIISIAQGTYGNELLYKDFKGKGKLKPLTQGFEHEYGVLNNVGDKLLVQTDDGAPNQRVVLVDPEHPGKENWKDIIAEKPELLREAATGGGKLFASYLKDVTSRVYQYDMDGKPEREITLPALGNTSGLSGYRDDSVLFYVFTSFTYPGTIYKYTIATGKSEVWRQPEVKFNAGDYETKQVFYKGKDGTPIPMFIVYKKGLQLNGNNPTLLYAYGGFNASIQPSFSASDIILLENGGVYALANIRGGGEYGDKWHKAGMKLNKQNVFDDFIAAAEYLQREKYTSPERLAILGGSNGGLLIGACITQRPELYKVAFPAVGVMDMLRFQRFTGGWGWIVEYGSSDSIADFKNLYSYSPLHNIKERADYPATLIFTADHDDRVVPGHSFKFAATLQEKSKGPNPALIRIETKTGHGSGMSTTKMIDLQTDMWSFMFYNMGLSPKYAN